MDTIGKIERHFKALQENLNGSAGNAWRKLRREAFEAFTANGFPKMKDEEYKYTHIGKVIEKKFDFSGLASPTAEATLEKRPVFHDADAWHVFIDNGKSVDGSLPEKTGEGLEITTLREAAINHPELMEKHLGRHADVHKDPFTALNSAFSHEGVFIRVRKNATIGKPIILHYTDGGSGADIIQTRNLIIIEDGATANIIESFTSAMEKERFSNHVSEISVGAQARLNYYKLQNQDKEIYQVDNTVIAQARDSYAQSFVVTLEGRIVRNNLHFLLEDENTETHLFGLYVAHGQTHVDNHTVVDHQLPHCYSNEIYKGILDNKSKGVFNGKIFVQPHAQKTNAFQSNKNILLTDEASIYTKPQLEIWADDVSCSHGCTTGQLDEEQLFYLRSRGINKSKARAMLLHAFVNDILDKIGIDFLHDYINEEMYKRLD